MILLHLHDDSNTIFFRSTPTGSQMLPPFPSEASSFWPTKHVSEQSRKLQDTIDLLKAVRAELDAISLIKESDCPCEKKDNTSLSSQKEENLLSFGAAFRCSKNDQSLVYELFEVIEAKKIGVYEQESLSYETANSLLSTLTSQLASFNSITCQTSSWEEMSMAVKLAYKIRKSKRNKRWQRKKRNMLPECFNRWAYLMSLCYLDYLFATLIDATLIHYATIYP